ncbi:hypothetical protein [Sphingomonas sp. S-NIH.Pt15_0812]|uniref:hypothetical protein n=1 Tax=Sphingomonas sp. S-NIH.Pt15_0812 TaxID=1920129 RepID=UPI000F7E71C2|nr:hypothetical protein [Sphingomonas sp. S-NIH.Pt15_0812]RSU47540.1 hypothetical protein BRX43_13985 [Sphingomonas sp. S-NIH.Pt15_0812]
MTFAIKLPQPGDRYFFIPAVPAGLVSPPLAAAIGSYVATHDANIEGPENPWTDAARAISNHVAASGAELAVKLLFVTHYAQPLSIDGRLAIDLGAFDVGMGHTLIRAAADALAMDAGRLWQEARAEYERLRAISDAMPLGIEGEDAAVDAYCTAMDALIATPAPTIQAAAYKMEAIQDRFADASMTDSAHAWEALGADLARLGGQA